MIQCHILQINIKPAVLVEARFFHSWSRGTVSESSCDERDIKAILPSSCDERDI